MAKQQEKCCKTCCYLRVLPDSAGRRVVMKGRAYTCLWGYSPEGKAVLAAFEGAVPSAVTVKYEKNYMEGNQGTTCPAWKPYQGGAMGPGGYPPPAAPEAAGEANSEPGA